MFAFFLKKTSDQMNYNLEPREYLLGTTYLSQCLDPSVVSVKYQSWRNLCCQTGVIFCLDRPCLQVSKCEAI